MLINNKNSFIVFAGGLLVGLILLNLISRDNFHRFDLTDNKKFSLSPSSKTIVSKLDDRLTIKVYFSDDLPSELGNTRRFLQDILEEYQALSDDVSFFFHAPESDSELEEQARKDGIQPVQMQALENDQMVVKKVYLGMVLLFENKKEMRTKKRKRNAKPKCENAKITFSPFFTFFIFVHIFHRFSHFGTEDVFIFHISAHKKCVFRFF